jgi:hypothetical protein
MSRLFQLIQKVNQIKTKFKEGKINQIDVIFYYRLLKSLILRRYKHGRHK